MQRIRWPKSYSIFSGSDSDLDHQGAAAATARGKGLHVDIPADASSAVAPVVGVYLFCAGDQVDLSVLKTPPAGSKPARTPAIGTATVAANDAIWKTSTPLPISQLIGIPLLMRRLLAKPPSTVPSSPHFDNPLASQLQVDPENDSATSGDSARGLGTVLVVRVDREPLNKELIDRICAFHAKLLNMAQQRGPGSMKDILRTQATPQKFIDFCMESLQSPGFGKAGITNSVHELLGDSWLELQRPVAAV